MPSLPLKKPSSRIFMVSLYIVYSLFYGCFAGIDNSKSNNAKKATPDAAAALSATNTETQYDKREAVYDANRDALTSAFK